MSDELLYSKNTVEPAETIDGSVDGFAIEQPNAGGDRKQKWLFLGVLRDWLWALFGVVDSRFFGIFPNVDISSVLLQSYIDYCNTNNIDVVFKNGIFLLNAVNIYDNMTIRTENATLKPSSVIAGGSRLFNGAVNNLTMNVCFETNNNNTGLIAMEGSGDPLTAIEGLFLDLNIIDSGDGSLINTCVRLKVRLKSPYIKVKGYAEIKNSARLVHNPHGSGDDENHSSITLDIDSDGWGMPFIHEGTGYATGKNIIKSFKVKRASGGGTGSSESAFHVVSTYHMRNLTIDKFYTIDCDRTCYLWKPQHINLLYCIGYTGANVDDNEQTPVILESPDGAIDTIHCEGSLADGVRVRWGGKITIGSIYTENNAGWGFIAKYDENGQNRIDIKIISYFSTLNGDGSILIENTIGTVDGVRSVEIVSGQGFENNQTNATPDVYLKGMGSGVRAKLSGVESDNSCDSAITVDGSGNYQLILIQQNDLQSAGTYTIFVDGVSTAGRRIIRDNYVDSRTKMQINGGSGVRLYHQNFGAAELDIADGQI